MAHNSHKNEKKPTQVSCTAKNVFGWCINLLNEAHFLDFMYCCTIIVKHNEFGKR